MDEKSDLLTVARERFNARDYQSAAVLLDSAIQSGQGYADAHHMLGVCYAMTDQREEALRAFDEALRLNPRYVEAHLNRSIILSDLGRAEEAAEALRRAHDLGRADATGFPTMVANRLANMLAELGRAYREAGALTEAMAQFRAALALRSNFADVRLELARALLEHGEVAAAARELDETLVVRPQWLEAVLLRGLAAYLAGDLERAASTWGSAYARFPDERRLETYRSMLTRKLGEQR